MPIDAEQWRAQTGLFCASRVLLRPPRCKPPKVQADTLSSLNVKFSLAVLLVTLRTGVFYVSRTLHLLWLIAFHTSRLLSSIFRLRCKGLRGVSVLLALCLVVVAMLLIMSGDVEENPGPPKIEAPSLGVDNLNIVGKELLDVSNKWYVIGLELRLRTGYLENIEYQNPDARICLHKMLLHWLEKVDPSPTWEGLACALESPMVGEPRLAEHLRTKFCKTPQAAGSDHSRLSEQAQKQLDKALKEGVVINCKSIVSTITGSAGVGKTCTLYLLLNRDPPKDETRTSTGLEKPIGIVVGAVKTQAGSEFIEWSAVNMLHEIAKAADTGIATSNEDNLDQVDTQIEHVSPDSSQKWSTLPTELQKLIEDIEIEMANLKVDPDQPSELNITYVYLFDSGGQPHFHELFQSFIPKVSVNIFVVNLSEPLTHCPKVSWYQDGESRGTPYDAPFSHEQLLQYTIQAMQLKSDNLKILVAGTHRDIYVEGGETIDQKNVKLMKMLQAFESNLIVSEGANDLIYPLNAKQPDDHDKEVAAEMRKVITNKCTPTESKPIPLRWHLLLQMIQKLGEIRKTGVVGIAECQDIAERLYIKPESFDAAIEYLANLNLLLYYPCVLKGVVFCDPHVILNKVTKLVWCSYLLNSMKKNVPENVELQNTSLGDWNRFRNFGFLNKELLTHQAFQSLALRIINDYGFTDDLFTPADFLTLLESLHMAAALELPCKTAALVDPLASTEKVYFLPCLRMRLEFEEIKKKRELLTSPSESTAPLLICFPGDWPPSGLFCKFAVSLLSTSGWEIRHRENVPTCLYRNCLEYYVEHESTFVTLIDPLKLGFFEVYVQSCGANNVSNPTILRDLRKAIRASWAKLHGLKMAVTAGSEEAFFALSCEIDLPKVAFVCTSEECECSQTHAAFGHPHTEKELNCSRSIGVFTTITDKHKMWAEDSEHPTTAMPTQSHASHLHSIDPNHGNPQGSDRSTECKGSERHPAFDHPHTATEESDCSSEEHALLAERENVHLAKQLPTAMQTQSDTSHLHSADPDYTQGTNTSDDRASDEKKRKKRNSTKGGMKICLVATVVSMVLLFAGLMQYIRSQPGGVTTTPVLSNSQPTDVTPSDFTQFPEPTLPQLNSFLGSKVAIQWEKIGANLGLDRFQLRNIEANNAGHQERQQRCLRDVFNKWYSAKTSEWSWKKIAEVLSTLDEIRVMKDLYEKLRQKEKEL